MLNVREGRAAMGTRFEVVCCGDDVRQLRAAAEEALDEVESVEAQLSRFRPESDLSGINAGADAEPVRADPQVVALLALARAVAERTGGAFDPAVLPLIRAWGATREGRVPTDEEVDAARAVSGWRRFTVDLHACTVRFDRPGVGLDLGAIGKGYGIDRAVEVLRLAGVRSALIHGGTSTVYGLGPAPDGGPWRVALRDPGGAEGERLGFAGLRDRALSVSAPHGQGARVGDRFFGHVLDPREGRPVEAGGLAAASHPSATLCDAVSTALLVAGETGLQAFGEAWSDLDLLLVLPDGRRRTLGQPDRWSLL